jgi:hypothetical protein
MYFDDHGGQCCGVRHIYGFAVPSETTLRRAIDGFRKRTDDEHEEPFNVLLEATLTDNQLEEGWAPILKTVGFHRGARFYNSNSGNWVTLFTFQTHERRGRNSKKVNYAW